MLVEPPCGCSASFVEGSRCSNVGVADDRPRGGAVSGGEPRESRVNTRGALAAPLSVAGRAGGIGAWGGTEVSGRSSKVSSTWRVPIWSR
jgi:hypothetical protein